MKCKHKDGFIFLRRIYGMDCFYCPHCRLYVMKFPDFTPGQVKKMIKELKGGDDNGKERMRRM